MDEGKKTYKVDGKTFDIPSEQEGAFIKQYPNAELQKSFIVGKDTFDIPPQMEDKFLEQHPDAEPTFGQKKSEEGDPSADGSTPMSRSRVIEVLNENKDKNFVQRILDPTTVTPLDRGGGVSSTHSMEWGEADGKYYVYPTVVEKDGKLVDISDKDPLKYALDNNEYIEFDNPEAAEAFSNDSGYKQQWEEPEELDEMGQEIANGDPDAPLLKKLSERNAWYAAPIHFLTRAVRGAQTPLGALDGAQRIFYSSVGKLMEGSLNPAIKVKGTQLVLDQDEKKTWFKQAQESVDTFEKSKLPPGIGETREYTDEEGVVHKEVSPYKSDLFSNL